MTVIQGVVLESAETEEVKGKKALKRYAIASVAALAVTVAVLVAASKDKDEEEQ